VIPVQEEIEKRQLSWLGHITRMSNNRKAKAIWRAESDKKRKEGALQEHGIQDRKE
jgi:hypothetical protein